MYKNKPSVGVNFANSSIEIATNSSNTTIDMRNSHTTCMSIVNPEKICNILKMSYNRYPKKKRYKNITKKKKEQKNVDEAAELYLKKFAELIPKELKIVIADKSDGESQTVPTEKNQYKVKILKMAAYIVEHASINAVDHFNDLLKIADSNVLNNNLKLDRTKCSMLIKNILSPCMLRDLILDIGNSPFSLILDEKKIGIERILCILIKYYSSKKETIITTFYGLVRIFEVSANVNYWVLTHKLKADKLPLENMVGIGFDGESILTEYMQSVVHLLQKDLPNLTVMECVSHSLGFCVLKAAETLPNELDYLVRKISKWILNNPEKLNENSDLYETLNNESYNFEIIATVSGTYWLAIYNFIDYIWQQWDQLKIFFFEEKTYHSCFTAKILHEIMDQLPFKAFFAFLHSILKRINGVNFLFSTEYFGSLHLVDDLFVLFKDLLTLIVDPVYLKQVEEQELLFANFSEHLLCPDAIYLGDEFETVAGNIPDDVLSDIRSKCNLFLCTLCDEIQKILLQNFVIRNLIIILDPSIATSKQKAKLTPLRIPSKWTALCGSEKDIEAEWNNLANEKWKHTDDIAKFWVEVSKDCDSERNKRFPNISKFALSLLTIPTSNLAVEQTFSIFDNSLADNLEDIFCIDVMQSLMMVRYSLKREYSGLVNFEPSKEMLERLTDALYNLEEGTADLSYEQTRVDDDYFDEHIEALNEADLINRQFFTD